MLLSLSLQFAVQITAKAGWLNGAQGEAAAPWSGALGSSARCGWSTAPGEAWKGAGVNGGKGLGSGWGRVYLSPHSQLVCVSPLPTGQRGAAAKTVVGKKICWRKPRAGSIAAARTI